MNYPPLPAFNYGWDTLQQSPHGELRDTGFPWMSSPCLPSFGVSGNG